MNLEVSGFFAPAGIYDVSAERLTPIHSSDGGFFEIYRGERAGQFRAFKCLKPEFRGNLLQETMLQKEFEIGFPLRHPGICESYSYAQVEPLGNCIEMEWIDGCTLEEFLKRKKPDEETFLRMSGELCDAISYLHAHQIIHGDIKPSNIMVTHQGAYLKLIDFSFSDSTRHVLLKQPAGTLSYAAPEVLAGQPADQASDIYSLGMVLSQMTSHHKKVLARCTEEAPSARYDSAAELKTALLRRHRIWPWAAVILLAAGIAWTALRHPLVQPDMPVPAEEAVPVMPEDDSNTAGDVSEANGDDRPAGTGATAGSKRQSTVSASDIDAIFNQASELFK